jgi:hypothetical protein
LVFYLWGDPLGSSKKVEPHEKEERKEEEEEKRDKTRRNI